MQLIQDVVRVISHHAHHELLEHLTKLVADVGGRPESTDDLVREVKEDVTRNRATSGELDDLLVHLVDDFLSHRRNSAALLTAMREPQRDASEDARLCVPPAGVE